MFKRSNRSQCRPTSVAVDCKSAENLGSHPIRRMPLGVVLTTASSDLHHCSPSTDGLVRSIAQDQSSPQQQQPGYCSHYADISSAEPFRTFFSQSESEVLRFSEDHGRLGGKPVHARPEDVRMARSECERVWRQYFSLRTIPIPEKFQRTLGLHTFNNWLHSDAQLLNFIRFMFVDLSLPEICGFPVEVLECWLLVLYGRYNDVPFHNFKHAFAVTQMMYSLIKIAQLHLCFSAHDLLILLFSALSHDLDHPGFTNSYQINVGSWLALRYNDQSPLENHHCAVAFDLISSPFTNITCGLNPTELLWFRKAVIKCILATDMATHGDCLSQFRDVLSELIDARSCRSHNSSMMDDRLRLLANDLNSLVERADSLRRVFTEQSDTRLTVMLILLKACDISNEVRPPSVADPWLDCLLDEFFYQVERTAEPQCQIVDRSLTHGGYIILVSLVFPFFRKASAERRAGLPVASHMDPEKVTRSNSQLGFLRGLLIPLLEDVSKLFPQLQILVDAATERVTYYTLLSQQQLEETELKVPPPDVSTLLPTTSTGSPEISGCWANPITTHSIPVVHTNRLSDDSRLLSLQPFDSHPCSAVMELHRGPVVESGSLFRPGSSRSQWHSDPQSVSASLLLTGFSSFDAVEYSRDSVILSDRVPSRKSSTGSMVTASS
ncbi:high affinity cGMP-specific 3',5'-cyclic phosphodiesterase 9 [Paragonimus westermani]|uniref:Phosphodiesterase n=1 Tax=Paragonimus westermani TaxID=34504 RepID=A0A5J4NTM3_9TREM|nr:high affinity cGMP-specific 3',5'-cyclic phosphodiesterase 9 [Paragonimus westermani]